MALGRTKTAAPCLQAQISEDAFLRQVLGLAKWFKWTTAHFRPGMTKRGRYITAVQGNGAGFPDLVLVRSPRVIFAELKSAKGKLSADQDGWLLALAGTPIESYVWRPAQIDEVERILK